MGFFSELNAENLIDITPMVSTDIKVWPGDVPYEHSTALDMQKGDNLTLSSIKTSVHLGAHADATNHYHVEGEGIEKRALTSYLGPCQVIEVDVARGERITISHLENSLENSKTKIETPRVLFKTGTFPDPNNWNNDFAAFSPELIEYLAKRGVKLIGIDTPSVDLMEDKELITHKMIYEHKMAILEGIVLEHVEPKQYNLIALPLKLKGADASPVRAILVQSN